MRVKSEIWVKAYLRTAAVNHCPGVVVRRGDAEAGAIFIKVIRRDGTATLYGPAPSGFDTSDGERKWVRLLQGLQGLPVDDRAVDAALEQEIRFDRDLWVVEIESVDGAAHLEGWLLATPA